MERLSGGFIALAKCLLPGCCEQYAIISRAAGVGQCVHATKSDARAPHSRRAAKHTWLSTCRIRQRIEHLRRGLVHHSC